MSSGKTLANGRPAYYNGGNRAKRGAAPMDKLLEQDLYGPVRDYLEALELYRNVP